MWTISLCHKWSDKISRVNCLCGQKSVEKEVSEGRRLWNEKNVERKEGGGNGLMWSEKLSSSQHLSYSMSQMNVGQITNQSEA